MKTTKTTCSGLDAVVDTPGKGAAGLTKLALVFALAVSPLLLARPTAAVDTLPILWEAGGQSAGRDSAGQAARVAADLAGNVAVVSGPSEATDLAVTSYTSTGVFRWQSVVSPSIGTFEGDWVAAAPNGDVVAVGHNINANGNPIAITLVRFGSEGTLQWRLDLPGTFPSVGRLLVDSGGNAYLAFNSVGDGQDIRLHKYSPSGTLLWSQLINTGSFFNNIATSLRLSADEAEVALTGDTVGGVEWITALYNSSTGVRKWLVVAPEGTAALDVVMDAAKVYVTGLGNVGINAFLSVVAYDRVTGTKLWRTDKKPLDAGNAAGLRIALAPDGSVVATGKALRGFLDWYTVAFETTGTVRWEAVRDGGLNTDEIPAAVLVLPDGTSVVTGKGGPNLPGGFIPGVTAGYSPNGALLWEAFSPLATVWAAALPNGDVVATGGYDAYLAAFSPSATTPTPTPTPTPTVQVTVQTNPVGRAFSVDGTAYSSTQTFTWVSGSSHTIATTSPQSGGTGVRYVWTRWSDSGALSHTVAPTTNKTYTATFRKQYYLTMSHGTGGTVRPTSGWRNSGAAISISAVPATGYRFTNWSGSGTGSYSGTNNPASITMGGPITEAATFTHN